MKLRKWLLIFGGAVLSCGAIFAAYNICIDPFGVFGDRLMHWYEYDMTQNPRVAKIAYLDQNYEKYDSYILGSSKASSIPVAELNEYMDASFYNMTWYGGDIMDEEQAADYIIEHYNVKNIIMTVTPDDAYKYGEYSDDLKQRMHYKVEGSSAIPFYLQYMFCNPDYGVEKIKSYKKRGYLMDGSQVYTVETGCYNKQLRDSTPIGFLDSYRDDFYEDIGEHKLEYIDEVVESISRVKQLCEKNNIHFELIGLPSYEKEFYSFSCDEIAELWKKLAEVTDFYDFWGRNTVTSDERFYYDSAHFRNCAGSMILAYMFGNTEKYVPKDFGHISTSENVDERVEETFSDDYIEGEQYTKDVPILMYHAFTDDPEKVTEGITYIQDFEDEIQMLKSKGYTAVFYRDLIDYVYKGKELPEKPVVITMDDGYADNIELAAPILEKYEYCATVAVIGVSVGKNTYKDTGIPITPHFSLEEAATYVEKNIIDIQTHTFDMHQVKKLDGEDCREGVLQMEGEDETEYINELVEDFERSKQQIQSVLRTDCNVYTYPYGKFDTLSEVVLQEQGIQVTVTINDGVNQLIKGIPQSLYQLKRCNVTGMMSAQDVMQWLKNKGVE